MVDAPTLIDLYLERVAQSPDQLALRFSREDTIRELTWRQIDEEVRRVVSGLVAAGIRPGDRVAQLSENRYEWLVADFAIFLSGAVHVPLHAPLAREQVQYQVAHSGARLLFVSGPEQHAKVDASLPRDVQLVSFEPAGETLAGRPVLALERWLEQPPTAEAATAIERAQAKITPDSLTTILYTSGTTGQPKGVMLSHRNLVTNAIATVRGFDMTGDDVRLCFLPLSHIFARTCDLYTWLVTGNLLCLATTRESVIMDCQWAQPTVINGVPYFYDLVARLCDKLGADAPAGGLRGMLGGRIHFCCSGGAALPDHLFDLYHGQGLMILQGYGLTESSPVISLSSPTAYRRGASGRAVPGVEVAIAADGEILTRGPHVMQGYWREELATAETIIDGWLHTGDLGRIDEDGFLYITGRKKELIVTAAGKNIAPVLLESLLTQDPLIEQALVIGDGRNYLSALIVPNWPAVYEALPELERTSGEVLTERGDVQALFERQIAARLACVSHHEQVRRFTLLDEPFSLERHELTPKLSLRRKVIEEHFREQIERMYER
jgi:long-chain acyl-CoA synthetase